MTVPMMNRQSRRTIMDAIREDEAMSRTVAVRARRALGQFIASAIFVLALCLTATAGRAADQRQFPTPEEAANALLAALEKDDIAALLEIFGPEYQEQLASGDEAQDRANRQQVLAAAREVMQLRADGDSTRTMVIGKQAWPMPIPIVKGAGGWSFDTAAGIDEIIARRIGANELATVANLRAYLEAQAEYAGADRDGDDVLEYAQRINSTRGQKDGLYWEVAEGSVEDVSPFGPFIAERAAYLGDREPGDPFMGYYYRILTRQGANAPGGRYDYIINGNMIAGFAMIAFPAEYGGSGVMTFIVSHTGRIYEKDLGEKTEVAAAGIQEYDLDDTWSEFKD
jgi:hypothetical protein